LPFLFINEQRQHPASGASRPGRYRCINKGFRVLLSAYFDYHRYFLVSDVNHWVLAPRFLAAINNKDNDIATPAF
jgi:hypothetical protein